jgi:O-antigen ligase
MPTVSRITLISFLIIITGIFTIDVFRALSSIGLGLLLIATFTQFNRISFAVIKPYLLPACVFLAYAFSLLYTNPENYGDIVRIGVYYLPFIIFPFAAAVLPNISRKDILNCYYWFLILSSICALGTLINFLLHFQEIIESYTRSKVMPTPVNHVRFSLIIAFATLVGAYLYQQKHFYKSPTERTWIGAMTVFLFIFIHILSVRSGILALYIGLLAVVVKLAFNQKSFKMLIIVPLALLAIPILAFLFVPTFKNKVTNTIEDINQIGVKGSAGNYSIAGRVVSYQAAWEILKKSPIIGSGIGNLKQEVHRSYKENFPEVIGEGTGILMPHNQFLYWLTALGVLGLILVVIGFYSPLLLVNQSFLLLSLHFIILSISFLFEATLETQTGQVFSLVFVYLPLMHFKSNTR